MKILMDGIQDSRTADWIAGQLSVMPEINLSVRTARRMACKTDCNLSFNPAIPPSCRTASQTTCQKYCLPSFLKSCYGWQMIIVIANSKGGVGKSTLAVHLAAWLHEQGKRVTLADCDMQQSSSEWIREAVPQVKAVRLDNPEIILDELPNLRQEADFVIADGPGSQSETSRALLSRADLAIVPCKASMLAQVTHFARRQGISRQSNLDGDIAPVVFRPKSACSGKMAV